MNVRVLAAIVAFALVGAAAVAPAVGAGAAAGRGAIPVEPLPARLSDTGLYADGSTGVVRPDALPFSPQYPLWSDGTTKRRWIRLPAGASIDASDPDAWAFPPGTRLWKEFRHGRPIETRYIERLADGSWRFATYVWNAEATEATLAPADGVRALDAPTAPGGRYAVPSRGDCLACHEGAPVPVLGFSALQLSSDRDPLAPHAEPPRTGQLDLRELAARGLVRNLPRSLVESPPRIAAADPVARAALGYLHGNCGHCHSDAGALPGLELSLAQRAGDPAASAERTLQSLVGHASRFRAQGSGASRRLVPGEAAGSVIALRMKSASALARMPPIGVSVVDREGVALVERWIENPVH